MTWLQLSETLYADAIIRAKSQKPCSSSKKVVLKGNASKPSEIVKSRAKTATVSAMAKRYRELNTYVAEIARDERLSFPAQMATRKLDSFFAAADSQCVELSTA